MVKVSAHILYMSHHYIIVHRPTMIKEYGGLNSTS
jgi:hypothetical protein